MKRININKIDKILGKKYNVLDDGFIRVIDYMGSDQSIVQAARVSYGKGTNKISKDRNLIRYLMRNNHTSPFEMCEIKLHIRVPMDCWRQWIRHRTANVNEYSTRYSVAIDSAQKTKSTEWRIQSKKNKQGSQDYLDNNVGKMLSDKETKIQNEIKEMYRERLTYNVAREQARKDLTLSTYTEAYWKIDLHNLFHFLKLRMDENAQIEIRKYANIIGYEIVSRWCPIAWEAFLEYRLNSLNLSKTEIELIKLINLGKKDEINKIFLKLNWLTKDNKLIKNRELNEFEEKIDKLKIKKYW